MKPLPIAAVGSFAQVAPAQPDSLRERVRAVCPNAPRRVNRVIELALIGAHRCAGGRVLATDTPIYMALTSGCIADSAAVVQQVAQGRPPMPLTFINISSNMAGFYVAGSLGLHSGNQVVASADFGWEAALELAMLGSAHCRGMLLGAVEECAWPLAEHRERLGLPADTPLLEASYWLLADRTAEAPAATIHWVRRFASETAAREALARASLPDHTRLALGPGLAEEAGWAQATGLPHWTHGGGGYSGLAAAAACSAFIQHERGNLLHVNRGSTGACYGVLLSVTPR